MQRWKSSLRPRKVQILVHGWKIENMKIYETSGAKLSSIECPIISSHGLARVNSAKNVLKSIYKPWRSHTKLRRSLLIKLSTDVRTHQLWGISSCLFSSFFIFCLCFFGLFPLTHSSFFISRALNRVGGGICRRMACYTPTLLFLLCILFAYYETLRLTFGPNWGKKKRKKTPRISERDFCWFYLHSDMMKGCLKCSP